MMRRLAISLALALSIGTAACVRAADWRDQPNTEYNEGHYEQALRGFAARAWQGDEVAQDNLGMMYAKGEGTPRDFAQAALWYRKAAQQGYAPAQRHLAGLYENGSGLALDIDAARDLVAAAALFSQAAALGDSIAQERLSVMQALASQQASALRLQQDTLADLRERAGNDAEAAYQLALAYAQGQLVTENWQQAEHWYQTAARNGHAAAQLQLGLLYAGGKLGAADLAQAAYWYRQAASNGVPKAANNLGVMYEEGSGVSVDRKRAAAWFRQGAEGGDSDAQFNLGSMYWLGHGVARDSAAAVHWVALAR